MTDDRFLLKVTNRFGTFFFSEPPEKDWLAVFGDNPTKKFDTPAILDRLVRVEGVTFDGKTYSPEDLRAGYSDLPTSFSVHLTRGFFNAWNKAMGADEAEAKNESAPAGT
jgi:hypothetical protein